MYKKWLNGLTLIFLTLLNTSCATKVNNPDHYRSSTESNLVASPVAVGYSPSNIMIYDAATPLTQSAADITTIQIDLYNAYGIRRQQAQVNEMLKEQACTVGGNAVVLTKGPEKNYCYAKVIQTKPASSHTFNSQEL